MKRTIITSLIVVMVLSIGAAYAYQADTGRGGPSGPHFNLNLIGMQKAKKADFDANCGNGHRIFVPMEGTKSGKPPVKIMLTESPDDVTFEVIDCDGTDGEAAFMLPNPDPGDDPQWEGCTRYSVWIRPLGIPGGKAQIRTCAEQCVEIDPTKEPDDPDYCVTWEEVCSIEPVVLERTSGKGHSQKFINVSKELLTICAEICTEYDTDPLSATYGECITYEYKRLYLFDEELRGYFWEYDADGLKLAQLRFYMEPTCYSENDWSCPPVTP
jgi:hypothetical protein